METPPYQILEIPEVSFEQLGKLLRFCDSEDAQLQSLPADWGWLDFDCPDVQSAGADWQVCSKDAKPFLVQVVGAQYDAETESFTVRIKFHFLFVVGKSPQETRTVLVSMQPLKAVYSILGVLPEEEILKENK